MNTVLLLCISYIAINSLSIKLTTSHWVIDITFSHYNYTDWKKENGLIDQTGLLLQKSIISSHREMMLTKAYLATKRYMETHTYFPQLTLLIRRETGFTNIDWFILIIVCKIWTPSLLITVDSSDHLVIILVFWQW